MNRITQLNRNYAASGHLAQSYVSVFAVGDPAGARMNAVVRRLLVNARDDGNDMWGDLVGAAKVLRWRMLTQPQPIEFNAALVDGVSELRRQIQRFRGAVADDALLDELAAAAGALGGVDPPMGDILFESVLEVGVAQCVVVASNKTAQDGLASWLRNAGVDVLTVGGLRRKIQPVDQAYVVGPPRYFQSSLVTAPATFEVSFLVPTWFGDRSIPHSVIATYADGAIRIEAREFPVGDTREPERDGLTAEIEDEFLPQPNWGLGIGTSREPGADEVVARKVLLSGGLAIWLDDGDRIRSLDVVQPAGERVAYAETRSIRPGSYLLLRRGETERGALNRAAVSLLGDRGPIIEVAQVAWKRALAVRLQELGYGQTVRQLRSAGVKTADRARAWTDFALVRPNRDGDFESLLRWLGIPIQPTFGYATMLRRAHAQASANLRVELESAVSEADLSALERDGHWFLEAQREGVRGLIATRVLAISPHMEVVSRHDARVPFEDRSGKWLE
jgi:hypothetical protein